MFVDFIFEWLCFSISFLCIILVYFKLKHRNKLIQNYNPELKIVETELGLSIVICIKGAAERFPSYFEKTISQDYSNAEFILVCFEISDKVQAYIDVKLNQNDSIFQFYVDENIHPFTEKKQALNLGISLAKYEYIVTIDDDCYPENEAWLTSINQHLQSVNSDLLLGLSPYISQSGFLNQWIRYDAYQVAENLCYHSLEGNPYMGIGRNMVFKKSLWSAEYLETYIEKGSGDDSSLVQYYSEDKKIDLMMSPLVYSFPKLRFRDWFFQKIRHIKSGNKLSNSQLIDLSILPLISLVFWILIWVWSSFLDFHLIIFGLIFIYLLIKFYFQISISKKLNFKLKPILYSIVFDFWYNLSIFVLPLISLFIKRKW
jgi:poly-beta-1,6-N-acetyl-D-glucosamine synthase